MTNYLVLAFSVLLIFTSTAAVETVKCKTLLNTLAVAQSEFVKCSTLHSVNIALCIGCATSYNHSVDAYQTLVGNKNCSEQFFDKDRINIVDTIQTILTGLWNKAYCDDCIHKNWVIFDDKARSLNDCLKHSQKDEICARCGLQYQDLNSFYKQLDEKDHGKVCYDIQDAMNRTRYEWSHDHKCCHRVFDKNLFLVTSLLILCIPFVFYGSLFGYTRHRERNHGLLQIDPENEIPSVSNIQQTRHNPVASTTPPSNAIHATQPPASSSKHAKMFAYNEDSDEDSDSDSDVDGDDNPAKHK